MKVRRRLPQLIHISILLYHIDTFVVMFPDQHSCLPFSLRVCLGHSNCLKCDSDTDMISIQNVNAEHSIPKSFAFDAVYDTDVHQSTVYDEVAFPLVESMLEGYNCTIFAYGQTGCGKTHTMMGVPTDLELRGIIPSCFAHIFGALDEGRQSDNETKYLVRCSYLEIYNEDVFDLLAEHKKNVPPTKLDVKEDVNKGVFVKDLKWLNMTSIPEMERAMNYGMSNRKTAATKMNSESSRSHSIFTIYIETATKKDGNQLIKAGKLNLVDLAVSPHLHHHPFDRRRTAIVNMKMFVSCCAGV